MILNGVEWVLRIRRAARGNKVHNPFGVKLCRRQKKRPFFEPSRRRPGVPECPSQGKTRKGGLRRIEEEVGRDRKTRTDPVDSVTAIK